MKYDMKVLGTYAVHAYVPRARVPLCAPRFYLNVI